MSRSTRGSGGPSTPMRHHHRRMNSNSVSRTAATTGVSGNNGGPVHDDRVMKDVPPIPNHELTKADLFCKPGGLPDLNLLRDHMLREGRLSKSCALHLIARAAAVFDREPNMLNIAAPITICGDIHGQFYDLVKLLHLGGAPGETQYLFLGDYVDRGLFACEAVFYLFALKLSYPHSFHMLRGNHECRRLTAYFTFLDECTHKYDMTVYEAFMSSFDKLPIAAVVSTPSDTFFCVHGGLSPDITTLAEVQSLPRKQEPPEVGGLCDLLWSDPDPSSEIRVHSENGMDPDDSDEGWFTENTVRGCSFLYGIEAVIEFLEVNGLTSIIRAHEAQLEGYKMHMMKGDMPRVITMFSAPNYCDTYRNNGAVLKVADGLLNIRQFTWEQHPYMLPHFMNVFDWSLPFVSEKVIDMLVRVLRMSWEEKELIQQQQQQQIQDQQEQADYEQQQQQQQQHGRRRRVSRTKSPPQAERTSPRMPRMTRNILGERGGVLRKKVMALTQMMRIYRKLRKHNEAITQLKQLTPNHTLPVGLLRSGSGEIHRALHSYEDARTIDLQNEKMPSMEDLFSRANQRMSRQH